MPRPSRPAFGRAGATAPPLGGADAPEEAGETERLLWRFGRRYAAIVRSAVLVPIGTIALLAADPEVAEATTVFVVVLVVWTGCYSWLLTRAGRTRVPLVIDVGVLLVACCGVFLTDPHVDVDRGPLRLLVTFSAVTYQWYAPPVVGGLATVVAVGGLLLSSVLSGADPTVLHGQAWVLVAVALSRAAWTLVVRAARRADALAAEAARVRRDALVEAAVRADQRDVANALHDTAATTLLMVGTGQVPVGTGWLAPQARRDLERLGADGREPPEHGDLVALLREDLDVGHLVVEFDGPARLLLPFGVARAIADAGKEALNNVRRHSRADRATVRLRGGATGLRLEIADEGAGFVVDEVPGTRRGLRHSVHERMSRIGGSASVVSCVGSGTVVRLEWHG